MEISRRTLLTGTGIALLSRRLLASAWSSRPFRLVAPFAAGGLGDFVARQITVP